jgi:hypothetical protein
MDNYEKLNPPMRDLTSEELKVVSGGTSLTLNHSLGGLPVLSFSFDGNQGTITFDGMTLPFGAGHPPVVLP